MIQIKAKKRPNPPVFTFDFLIHFTVMVIFLESTGGSCGTWPESPTPPGRKRTTPPPLHWPPPQDHRQARPGHRRRPRKPRRETKRQTRPVNPLRIRLHELLECSLRLATRRSSRALECSRAWVSSSRARFATLCFIPPATHRARSSRLARCAASARCSSVGTNRASSDATSSPPPSRIPSPDAGFDPTPSLHDRRVSSTNLTSLDAIARVVCAGDGRGARSFHLARLGRLRRCPSSRRA